MNVGAINSKELLTGSFILKPNFHLNYGRYRLANYTHNGGKHSTLSSQVRKVYRPGIFKRIFIENEANAYPYVTASIMGQHNPLASAKNISKKYTPWVDQMTLRDKQILISCAGTIGNSRLITRDLEGAIGSQDIIRVVPFEKNYGFIYAFLASPTCYNYVQALSYGSVVPRLDPDALANISIPQFPEPLQQQIHQLITEASELRVEANELLSKSHEKFSQALELRSLSTHNSSVSNLDLQTRFQKRLDASYYLNIRHFEDCIRASKINLEPLKKLLLQPMFTAQRGKRNYVKKNGIKFLSTSDISQLNPTRIEKYLSWKTTGLSTLIVHENWILVASSGQEILGSAYLIDDDLDDIAVNQHSIRVIIDQNKISPYYIYGYLSHPKVKEYIRSGIYGSAILTINEAFLENLLVPILEDSITKEIGQLVERTKNARSQANKKENQAITLVENEIDSWQNSKYAETMKGR
jgi:type I restriction enzyme S subunit